MILFPHVHIFNIFSELYNHFFKNKPFFHEDKTFKHIFSFLTVFLGGCNSFRVLTYWEFNA